MSQAGNVGVKTGAISSKRSKYVSRACEPCRQRRVKCNGRRPACSSCLAKSIDCHYSTTSDRRKPASKSYVQLLRDRIDLLERVLKWHSIDVDSAVAKLQADNGEASSPDASDGNATTAQFEEMCAAFEGILSIDEPINYDRDGEAHYFGPTSGRLSFQTLENTSCNNHLTSKKLEQGEQYCWTVVRYPSPKPPPMLEVDADLQAELIDLYFAWQNPWFPILNETLFRASRQQGDGRYTSPLLLNCVLAAGSRFSDRHEVRIDPSNADTAGMRFLQEAEILLHYDLKSPSLTTIQAVSIMIILYCSHGADAAGWLHQGTAHRLALDMGLNYDTTSVAGSSPVSDQEVNLRQQIYWSLYCTDKLHASYSGRVCTMLEVQGSVKLPSVKTETESSIDFCHRSECTTSLLRWHVTQSQILEKVLLAFYAPQPSHTGSRREIFFNTTLVELQNWLYDLPDELRLDSGGRKNTFPQAYTLHMCFYTILILLGNAMLASNARAGSEGLGNNTDSSSQRASSICYKAAINLCNTAKKYRSAFGSFRRSPISATHCLLSAALVLIQVASAENASNGGRAATVNFDLCLQCLEELSISWVPARRMHQNLVLVKEQKLGPSSSTSSRFRPGGVQSPLEDLVVCPALEHASAYSSSYPLDMDALIGHDFVAPVLLNDTHSFLETCSSGNIGIDGLDFAAEPVDAGMQDPCFWGTFGMDFTTGPSTELQASHLERSKGCI